MKNWSVRFDFQGLDGSQYKHQGIEAIRDCWKNSIKRKRDNAGYFGDFLRKY